MDENIEKVAELFVEKSDIPDNPFTHEKERTKLKIMDAFTARDITGRIEEGFTALSRKMKNPLEQGSIDKIKAFLNPDNEEKIKNFQEAFGTVDDLYCLKDEFQLSDHFMFEMYKTGVDTYEQEKQYADAANIFLILAVLDPLKKEHWLSYGMVEHKLHRFEDALRAYAIAIIYDIDDPVPYYCSGQCYLGKHEEKLARFFFEKTLEVLKKRPMPELEKEVKAVLETMRRK